MTINVGGFDRTGATDNSDKLAAIAQTVGEMWAAKKPLPRMVFPEGIYKFSKWPDLAYDNLEIVAEGEVRLMGNVCFDASLRAPKNPQSTGIDGLLFSGFHVYGSAVFRGVHRSNIHIRTIGGAVALTFCVATFIEPQTKNAGGTGLLIDAWPGRPDLQTTACTIWNPILEGCGIGLDMQSAGSCAVYNGTIENCTTGVHLAAPSGNNMFYSVEMEGNKQDVLADSGSHKNGFLYCGNDSKLSTNFGLFNSNWAQH